MSRKSRNAITREKIIQATIALAGDIGLSAVSFPRLAEYFEIKAPSLYNHFKNMEEVRVATAVYLEQLLNHQLTQAMVGTKPRDALRAYAASCKQFSEDYAAVYELLNLVHQTDNADLERLALENIDLISKSLSNFDITPDEIVHKSRFFRATLHGFINLSQLGYFQNDRASRDASFDYMVKEILETLKEK